MFRIPQYLSVMLLALIAVGTISTDVYAIDVDYHFEDTQYSFQSFPDVQYRVTFYAVFPNQNDVSLDSVPYGHRVEQTQYGQMTIFTLKGKVTMPNPPVVYAYGIVQKRVMGGSWTFVKSLPPQ